LYENENYFLRSGSVGVLFGTVDRGLKCFRGRQEQMQGPL